MCYNPAVYLYIVSRAGHNIPAYCPLAEQEGDMQYIVPTEGRAIYFIHRRYYSI